MVNYFIGSTFTMALALLIGTLGPIGWLITLSMVLIGIINTILLVYLGISLISLYGLYMTPDNAMEQVELSHEEILESMELLNNPFIPRSYNVGIFLTFIFSFAHMGTVLFSYSIAMMIFYIGVFMTNKKMIELVHDLTLD